MECFRQIAQLVKSPFQRTTKQQKALEIGPPTNFRKEESPVFFSDDDTLTTHSLGSTLGKSAIVKSAECQTSTREKIKHHVRKMSVKLPRPQAQAQPSKAEIPPHNAEIQPAQELCASS